MIPYEEWEIIYDDSEIEGRRDPQEQEGYGMHIKGSDNYLLFPRGTLKEVAIADRPRAKRILENLTGNISSLSHILRGTNLTLGSIVAVACKMYIREEERYQSWMKDKS